MVKRIYLEDPYQTECEANVVSINGNEVILDKTVFFAFAGGQASDSGTINNIEVKQATKKADEIVYTLENINFKEGDKVIVKIDEEKRKKIMKLHSAIHIVYYIFEEIAGSKKIIGSNVTEDKARFDYKTEESCSDLLEKVQEAANKVFSEDNKIETYPDPDNPEKKWWECKDWICPCGGTHVKNTNEIGSVKLKRKNIGAGKERVEIRLN
jgi:alanyl-tRNA synthetase